MVDAASILTEALLTEDDSWIYTVRYCFHIGNKQKCGLFCSCCLAFILIVKQNWMTKGNADKEMYFADFFHKTGYEKVEEAMVFKECI